ncbi:MAG: hypothetical protein ACRCYS_05995 [Beijerinckiaceae bacterium]
MNKIIVLAVAVLTLIAAVARFSQVRYEAGYGAGYGTRDAEYAEATRSLNAELATLKTDLANARKSEEELQKTVLAEVTKNMGLGELSKGECRVIPEDQRARFNKVK